MTPLPTGTKIWLVAGITDMRNGFNGLAAKVQTALKDDPMSGHVFIFRARFVWPSARDGKVVITLAQPAMLLEDIYWRQPKRQLTPLSIL